MLLNDLTRIPALLLLAVLTGAHSTPSGNNAQEFPSRELYNMPQSPFKEQYNIPQPPPKELYLPAKIWNVPENNDFRRPESEFCYERMVQSDNIAVFWSKEFGNDPAANPDTLKRFDVHRALKECERFYDHYVHKMKFLEQGRSWSDKYKILLFVIGGKGATAFGGGADNKVGILWTPAARMNKYPYGALAHELGHSFQYLSRADNEGRGPGGPIAEMSAQYFLWQVYPEWMTFENYHLKDYLKKTHYAFLHPTNMYHSPYVIEYWSNKHGIEFFGRLSRETLKGEDVVSTYKRLNNVSQDAFNDEMFDAARRFITWDMKRIEEVARPYANMHSGRLETLENGWYRIAHSNCPQNYGYNGIRLKVPAKGGRVKVDFRGLAGAPGFSNVKTDKAGWRYGFVAYKKDGARVYSEIGKKPEGVLSFQVPAQTEYLWLVVSGAPTEHWPVPTGRNVEKGTEEQWPYQVKLAGTTPE